MKKSLLTLRTMLFACLLCAVGASALTIVRAYKHETVKAKSPSTLRSNSPYKLQTKMTNATAAATVTAPATSMFASFQVSKLADTNDGVCDADCSLREAITAANTNIGADTITFAPAVTGTINLTGALPNISDSLTILGPGADQLTVRRDTGGDYRIFTIGGGHTINISGLTITNGKTAANQFGGGIFSASTLNLTNCAIINNEAVGLAAGGGIALDNGGSFTGCTISGNRAGFQGGGINYFSVNPLTITNCTIAENFAPKLASGIEVGNGDALIVNSTIANNTGAMALYTVATGTGATSQTTLRNCIISNPGIKDLEANIESVTGATSAKFISQGNNITRDGGSGYLTAAGDLINTNPLLAPLSNYGGPTPTMALLPGSPAINAGTASGAPTTDQRGIPRPQNGVVDIGAFESRGFTLAINSGNNQSTPAAAAFANPLRVTVTSSTSEPVDGGQITFTPPSSGATATIAGNPATISGGVATTGTVTANNLIGGPYTVSANGIGAAAPVNFSLTNICPTITVNNPATTTGTAGTAFSQAFTQSGGIGTITFSLNSGTLPSGITLASNGTLSGTTLQFGSFPITVKATDSNGCTGISATYNLTINCVTDPIVTTNADDGAGSLRRAIAIACPGSTITFANSVISPIVLTTGNLRIEKNLTIQGPGANILTISGNNSSGVFITGLTNHNANVALSGLTIANGKTTNDGGGINNQGILTVTECAIVNNQSGNNGGGIENGGTLVVNRSTISGNKAATGAGLHNFAQPSLVGNATLTNCTLSGNTATGSSGAILNIHFGGTNAAVLVVNNCTIDGNSGTTGGGIRTSGQGGGPATTSIKNSIITNNVPVNLSTAAVNSGVTVTSLGNNLTNDGGGGFLTAAGDLINTNPQLAPLGNYGGPTPTMALLTNSPAINAGNNTGAPTTDQRGITRPQASTVDIGAYEVDKLLAISAVTGSSPEGTGAGTTPFTFTVSRTGSTDGSLTLNYAVTGSGIAPANAADFGGTLPSGTVTIPDGSASTTFTINISKDNVVEATEQFTVTLSAALIGYAINTPTANSTITNDDIATIAINDVTQVEGNAGTTNFVFNVSLSNLVDQPIVVNYATANSSATTADSDYAAKTGTITFPANSTTMQTVTITGNGDLLVEGNETFFVNLTPNALAYNDVTIVDGQGLGTITNDDSATVSINDVTVTEGNSGSVNAVFTITLSNPVDRWVSVFYQTQDGSATLADTDYNSASGAANFAPGTTTQTVSVTVRGDTRVEPDETFRVNLTLGTTPGATEMGTARSHLAPTVPYPDNVSLLDAQGEGRITNDDFPPFTAALTDPLVCNGVGGAVQVTAQLTNPNPAAAVASFSVTLPTLLSVVPGSCTASLGTCAVTPPGLITWNGNIPANTTLTITYQAQIADGTPQGTTLTISSDASVAGVAVQASATGTTSCPAADFQGDPALPAVSDQKAGSVLVFPYYHSQASTQSDTRISLSNVGAQDAFVHLFFLDGATCEQADFSVCITPNGSYSFRASEVDPELTGWLLAVVVDAQGRPIQQNVLIGNAYVQTPTVADNYTPSAFWAYTSNPARVTETTATLRFDDTNYDAVPNQFAVEVLSPRDVSGQRLVTVGLAGDLTQANVMGAAQVGAGLVFNANEEALGSFVSFLTGKCQASGVITTNFPRVPRSIGNGIPSGQAGLLRINIGAGVGLLFTPRTGALPWSGIRPLHQTSTTFSTLTIPIFPPQC